MLVLTRKTDEVVTIDNWMHVVPTEILETQITVNVHAARPFQAAVSFANTVRFPVPSTSFEFVLESRSEYPHRRGHNRHIYRGSKHRAELRATSTNWF